jgi:predicted ATP-grasp superfamily ATP-dependent carboligase
MGAVSFGASNSGPKRRRALIVDTRAVLGFEVCRSLRKMGWEVDVFAQPGSPVFRSRACHRPLVCPHLTSEFVGDLTSVVESGNYEAIYLCSEEILELLIDSESSSRWAALPLSEPWALKSALSKNAMVRLVHSAGVAVPHTIIPAHADAVVDAANQVGLPVVIKGDTGEASRNVRLVRRPDDLQKAYNDVLATKRAQVGMPAVQEFIPGPQYSVGGLFQKGEPLRVFAYRKLVTYPVNGGLTAKAVTERVPELLDAAFAVFAALQYTGLGQVQFIRDERDGRFKFLEINPRVWACIGLCSYAGVDLHNAYINLACGFPVKPNLQYETDVFYHRFSVEMRVIMERPRQLPRFLWDCLDRRVHSDFSWYDPGPHLPSLYTLKVLLSGKVPGTSPAAVSTPQTEAASRHAFEQRFTLAGAQSTEAVASTKAPPTLR